MIEIDNSYPESANFELPANEQTEKAEAPERDELDDLVDGILDPVEEATEEPEGEEEQTEEDEDASLDLGSSRTNQESDSMQRKGRSAQRRAKLASDRDFYKSQAAETKAELEQQRKEREALKTDLDKVLSLNKQLLQIVTGQDPEALTEQLSQAQQPARMPQTPEELKQWYKEQRELEKTSENEVMQRQTMQQQTVTSEIKEIQKNLLPSFKRAEQTSPHIASWLDDDFSVGIVSNDKRRHLLRAVSTLSYSPEALYAASKTKGFDSLSLESQVALTIKCNNKFSERISNRASLAEPREQLIKPTSSSVSHRRSPSRMSTEDYFMEAFPHVK